MEHVALDTQEKLHAVGCNGFVLATIQPHAVQHRPRPRQTSLINPGT